jgi:hypothetical protein
MKRQEHNRIWMTNREPGEDVLCNTVGYGEISQYDSRCSSCWLGHDHTWDQHDTSITRFVEANK